MEFPGILGAALWRLKTALQTWPVGALGPFFGIVAADMFIDIMRGRYGSAGVEIAIAPMIAIAVLNVSSREPGGMSSMLMFFLGTISGVGAAMLITRGLQTGTGFVFMMGLRHLVVMAYAWASIASEPPVRHRTELAYAPY